MRAPRQSVDGFTLVEALVALAVLALAATALLGATQAHLDRVGGLEARAAAGWVAENRLAELRLAPSQDHPSTVEMLDRRWRIETARRPTGDPDIVRADVTVSEDGGTGARATLTGFIDVGGVQ
ncbi:MAG: type II secretion system minor pseudopilin GspI [Maricaulaceae bacterium]